MDQRRLVRHKSDFELPAKAKELLSFAPHPLGQSCPQRYPHPEDPLGVPLSILEVARLIGCSPWTIRQKYIPAGLPHHRLTPYGKLIFYRNQVIRWLLACQQKGVPS
jgi:hypothetical protein